MRSDYTLNIYFFSLPCAFPKFLPTFKEPNFSHLNLITTLPPQQLSSASFNNVRSVSLNDRGEGNANLLALKFVPAYFRNITTLIVYNDHITRTMEYLTVPDELGIYIEQ